MRHCVVVVDLEKRERNETGRSRSRSGSDTDTSIGNTPDTVENAGVGIGNRLLFLFSSSLHPATYYSETISSSSPLILPVTVTCAVCKAALWHVFPILTQAIR